MVTSDVTALIALVSSNSTVAVSSTAALWPEEAAAKASAFGHIFVEGRRAGFSRASAWLWRAAA